MFSKPCKILKTREAKKSVTVIKVCLNVFFFQMVLSDDIQTVVGIMVWVAEAITDMMDKMLPAIKQLQIYLNNIKNLNLAANNHNSQVSSFNCSTFTALYQ